MQTKVAAAAAAISQQWRAWPAQKEKVNEGEAAEVIAACNNVIANAKKLKAEAKAWQTELQEKQSETWRLELAAGK